MVMYDNEFETKENKIYSKDKIEPQHKQVKILLVKILNIFLVKLIFLPFERVSCGRGN